MAGIYYERLVFPFAASGAGGGEGDGGTGVGSPEHSFVAETRAAWRAHEARHSDDDEMLCFMRWLDRDGDGFISTSDLCHAVIEGLEEDPPSWSPEYHKKWQALKGLRMMRRALDYSQSDDHASAVR